MWKHIHHLFQLTVAPNEWTLQPTYKSKLKKKKSVMVSTDSRTSSKMKWAGEKSSLEGRWTFPKMLSFLGCPDKALQFFIILTWRSVFISQTVKRPCFITSKISLEKSGLLPLCKNSPYQHSWYIPLADMMHFQLHNDDVTTTNENYYFFCSCLHHLMMIKHITFCTLPLLSTAASHPQQHSGPED